MLPMTAVEEDKDAGDHGQGKQGEDPEKSAGGAATVPKDLTCPVHGKESQLSRYCRNCEVLVCGQCLQEQHLQCPEKMKVPVQEYAREEREGIKSCRVKYAQVMRFFTEQRRDTEERLAALNVRKHSVQAEVRKFFSALLKACMDVEGSLLQELENSVADHMDMLTEQSRAWKELQDSTQQLLDITDVLHFLPTSDFLPLMEASKSLLSQALREGETLTGATPPEMSMELCLAQSSQRSVVKRIKEIGATALNITTHKTLTLRKVTGMSLCTEDDKTDPLVTSMTLLTPTMLLAADFNNSCLKRFQKEEEVPGACDTESWNCTEILPLKWKPYGMSKLSEEAVTACPDESNHAHGAENQQGFGIMYDRSPSPFKEVGDVSTKAEQSAEERPETEIHLAVTSPLAGCFEVVVPVSLSSHRRMRVVRAIQEEKGFWGLGLVGDHKLALSTVASGRSYISLQDTTDGSTTGNAAASAATMVQRLALTSDTSVMPVVTPRHILPTGTGSFIVGDHGKNAVIHASTNGKVLFTFTGNGSQRMSCPEGLCMDVQGHMYIADSGNHSIFVLTKGGHLYSKTRSQQNDLSFPQALCIDRNSRLYVANEGGKLLAVYEMFQES